MNKKLNHIFRSWPIYTWLLPVFFVIHYLSQYFDPSLYGAAFKLAIVYIFAASLIMVLSWLFFKNWIKAGLLSFTLLAFNFFFGPAHDFLKKLAGHSFFIKYTFILPLSFILLIILVVYLKKTKHNLARVNQFLNILFILLIAMDLVVLLPKIFRPTGNDIRPVPGFVKCDSCERPDIYLIIADEYAGKTELRDIFSFDNSGFENELRSRGFHLGNNSTSNYNATVYSMASMLNMDYLRIAEDHIVNHPDMLTCRRIINSNNAGHILEEAGYQVYNNSFFDLAGKKKTISNFYFPSKTALINAGSFLHRFRRDMGAYFASGKKIESVKKNDLTNDYKTENRLKEIVSEKSSQPKFVYSHFSMPHHPYFLDSSGKEIAFENLDQAAEKKAYLGYLLYANKKLLELANYIKSNSARPAVILIMGDHGFRQLPVSVPQKYYFMNLNAVYLPSGNYSLFQDGMSNVNQFRIILNSVLNQRLEILKDSTIFLTE